MKSLDITPTSTSSAEDFDFLIGSWRIANRKLNARLGGCIDWTDFETRGECRKILNGQANTDSIWADFDVDPFEGYTLRLFDPQTRLWSIYWADSVQVTLDVPQIGSFEGRVGEFFARDMFNGIPIIVKFRWDATDVDAPVWSQAFSTDEGETWEWNWFMNFSRTRAS